jgi:hypothetical protein
MLAPFLILLSLQIRHYAICSRSPQLTLEFLGALETKRTQVQWPCGNENRITGRLHARFDLYER